VTAITENEGTEIKKPGDPAKADHDFLNWYDTASGGNLYSWPYTLTGDVTMFALWGARADPVKAEELKLTHAGILAKTVDTITTEDETAVNAALNAYYALNTATQALLKDEKTLLDSLMAQILHLKSKEIGFTFIWADEDQSLLSDVPTNLVISKNNGDVFTIRVAEDMEGIQWSLNGKDIPAPRGTGREITFEAASYIPGRYTLRLDTNKGEVPYSINIIFTVSN
jgi:hypothetical protein